MWDAILYSAICTLIQIKYLHCHCHFIINHDKPNNSSINTACNTANGSHSFTDIQTDKQHSWLQLCGFTNTGKTQENIQTFQAQSNLVTSHKRKAIR